MSARKVIQVAWIGLNRNRLRSLLTMLGVIIGVAAVIVMVAVSNGTEATIKEQIQGLGTNLVFVQSGFFRAAPGRGEFSASSNNGLTMEDANAIADQIPGVSGVVVEQNSSQTVKFGGTAVDSVPVLGTTPGFPTVRDIKVSSGRYLNQTDLDRKNKVAVLGSSLANELFGDQSAVGQVVTVGDVKLVVIGVMAQKGLTSGIDYDSYLFTPITVVFQKFVPNQFARLTGNSVRLIYVKVANEKQIDKVVSGIETLLAKRHNTTVENATFTVRTQQDIINTQESATAAFRNLLAWVAGVSLLVGGIGIMNIMLVSVTERTREIGIRQSVGATPGDIRRQFLAEALLLSLVGGLIGILSGVGGSWLFQRLGDMRTVVAPASIALAFTSAAAVGIFFGFYPANKAALLDPIEALRHE